MFPPPRWEIPRWLRKSATEKSTTRLFWKKRGSLLVFTAWSGYETLKPGFDLLQKSLQKSCNCFSWSWPSRIVGTSGTHHTSTHFPKCQPSGQRAKGTKPIASDSPVSCCMVSLPHPFSTMKLRAGWLCTNANFGFLTFTSSPEMTERHSFHTDPSNTNGWLWYRVSTQFQRLNSTKVAEANSKRLHFKIF